MTRPENLARREQFIAAMERVARSGRDDFEELLLFRDILVALSNPEQEIDQLK